MPCDRTKSACGSTLNVGFAGFWPYIYWSETETRVIGVDVMLMDILEEKMNFNYEIVDPFFNRPIAEIIGKVRRMSSLDIYFSGQPNSTYPSNLGPWQERRCGLCAPAF